MTEPPETVKSAWATPATASLKSAVTVNEAVCVPNGVAINVAVGGAVSITTVLVGVAATLALPTASVATPAAISMVKLPETPVVGVILSV